MARYSAGSYGSQKNRRRVYIISAILVITAVMVFVFGRTGKKQQEPSVVHLTEPRQEEKLIDNVTPDVRIPSIAFAPVAEPNLQTTELIHHALDMLNQEPVRIIDARDMLNDILHSMPTNSSQRDFVKQKLSELAAQWLFSRRIFPQDGLCDVYKVKSGDLLSKIGKRNKVPHEILMDINNIVRPEALRAGDKIKVINGPFHARIYRSTFTMDLYLQNTFVRTFSVGLGKAGMETPTGRWVVKKDGKLLSPTWTDPDTGKRYEPEDPNYPLGSRWIGLQGIDGQAKDRTGFAIHGTNDVNEIGKATSRGCIRLHNGNAVLVYSLMTPALSQVVVVE